MDYRASPKVNYFRRQRLQGRQSSPALSQLQTPARGGQQPYSSPLPQTQWAEIPSPYRPRDLLEPDHYHHQPGPRYASQPSRSVPPPSEQRPEQGQERRRRRVRGFRDLLQRDSRDEGRQREADTSLLYPELNPYSNDSRLSVYSSYSAPDELGHQYNRSVSSTNAPGHLDSAIPLPLNTPRSPTYPPPGRRRIHSTTGASEAAFADEAEYRLFVEATAGLSPDMTFHHPFGGLHPPSLPTTSPRRTQSERISTIFPTSPRDVVSPVNDTPTTRFALHQLAQMPHGSTHPPLEPLQTLHADVGMWVQPPSAEPEDFLDEQSAGLDLGGEETEEEHDDDELPGYAESQAQAQQHQRAHAARRAQELQMRWQQSGERRGV